MARNRQAEERQRLKGYLLTGTGQRAFWYADTQRKSIGLELGTPIATSEKIIETESNLKFEINAQVKIGSQTRLIDDIDYILKDNKNSLRGSPSYIKRMTLK